jgi:hypothetical protein
MGRPRIGTELKKHSDYKYDYPEQRSLAKGLLSDDRSRIAEITGYSPSYIMDWCAGTRKNAEIEHYVRLFVEINNACHIKKECLTSVSKEKQINS